MEESNSGFKAAAAKFNKGLLTILRPLQIAGNFVFLGLAYFLGIGLSALLYRIGPGLKKRRAETVARESGAFSYWRETSPVPRDRDAWLRPF